MVTVAVPRTGGRLAEHSPLGGVRGLIRIAINRSDTVRMNTIFANQRRDTRNRLLRNVPLLVVGTAVALALGDVAVRLLDIPPRPMAALPVPNYQRSDNPLIGYEYIPSFRW